MLKTFSFFSFVQVLECVHCIYVMYFKFYLYFTLAKDGECKSIIYTYVLTIVNLVFLFSKKKKKKTEALAWVKNSKVMPQLPHYLSFLLGKGGKPLYLKPY